jgi:hypothetical protein
MASNIFDALFLKPGDRLPMPGVMQSQQRRLPFVQPGDCFPGTATYAEPNAKLKQGAEV